MTRRLAGLLAGVALLGLCATLATDPPEVPLELETTPRTGAT